MILFFTFEGPSLLIPERDTRYDRKRMRSRAVFLIAAVLLTGGCAKKHRAPRVVVPRPGFTETGVASWYGHPYHGRRAADGSIYNMEEMTAAHRTFAFGTRVQVLNLENGKSCEVRITDRGPFVDGRIIDLSRAAARKIEMIGPGTARVRLRVLGMETANDDRGGFAVQAGAFSDKKRAERVRREMAKLDEPAILVFRDGDPPMWRVLVGRKGTREEAEAMVPEVRAKAGIALVVRLDEEDSDTPQRR